MTTASSPLEDYQVRFSGSAALHGRAAEVLSDYSERSAAGRHPLSGELRSLFPCTDIAATYDILRPALLLEGVDSHRSHGWISSTHDEQVIDEAIGGFERAFRRARRDLASAITVAAP